MKLERIGIGAGLIVAAAVIAWLWASCAHRGGVAEGKQMAHDSASDARNAALKAAIAASDSAWQRRLDSLGRAAAVVGKQLPAQRRRADSLEAALVVFQDSFFRAADVEKTHQAWKAALTSALGVIQQDSTGIRARDLRIFSLRDSLHLYTDSIVPQLTRDRDWWKKRASSPCGPTATGGYGVKGLDAVAGFGCRLPFPHLF